jgi:hypothetical protein
MDLPFLYLIITFPKTFHEAILKCWHSLCHDSVNVLYFYVLYQIQLQRNRTEQIYKQLQTWKGT